MAVRADVFEDFLPEFPLHPYFSPFFKRRREPRPSAYVRTLIEGLFFISYSIVSYQMRVFHQNESCLACRHPPSSYEGGREQVGSSHFDGKLSF